MDARNAQATFCAQLRIIYVPCNAQAPFCAQLHIIYAPCNAQAPFRARKEKVKRDEVDRRVKEDQETYSDKFSEDIRSCCMQVMPP